MDSNKWHHQELIRSEKHGREATVERYDNYVLKTYKPKYFKYNRRYRRRGEIFYLQKYPSPFFPSLLEHQDGFIVMPHYGNKIYMSRRKCWQIKSEGLNYLGLVAWINGLRKELTRLQLLHRDINPTNILYDQHSDKYMLIDFGWMIMQSDLNKRRMRRRRFNPQKLKPKKLNPYAKDDNEALDKISINAIKILLSRIGSDGYRDGSSIKRGWTYHPIPFLEFKDIPTHKTAAIEEYKEVLKYGELENKKNLNILDIGSSVGYFSFQLATLGNFVTGIEADSKTWEVAEAIRIFKGFSNINFINAKLNSEIMSGLNNNFDLTIILNVHMWIYKQLGAEQTMVLMRQLSKKTKKILFQTAGMQSGGKYLVKEFIDNVSIKKYLEVCGFNNVTHLRDTDAHGGKRALFVADGNI